MLRLLPKHPAAPVAGARPAPVKILRPADASALAYTLLRHGRGLSHQEAERRLREGLDGPFQAA